MSRWHNAGEYAQELDQQLEELAAAVRRAPGAKTDAELQQARWHASGLERARELLVELLNAGPSRPTTAATAPTPPLCASLSSTGLRCTLPSRHGGMHRAPGQEWITPPSTDPVCSRCLRSRSRHGAGGRDAECPDGFVARDDSPGPP
jgi:hypothetical protein